MSSRWVSVVAGKGVSLTTVVGGTTLALRHARTAQRIGCQGIVFVIPDDEQRSLVEASFQTAPAPEGISLAFSATGEASSYNERLQLEASGLYMCDGLRAMLSGEKSKAQVAPDFRIQSNDDVKEATRFLYSQIRKSVEMDGIISYYVMRPLARLFTQALLNTSVSPNQATLVALACGIAAAIFAALGSPLYAIFAGIFYWFGGVIDCIDGELARLRLQSSKLGEWLDSMVDEFSTIALLCGIGIGLTRDGYGDQWQLMACVGATVATLTLGRMYTQLHKDNLAIDTAHFPWFFASTATKSKKPPTIIGSIINFVGHFIRRDANLTVISLLLILNLRIAALCTMLVAFSAVTLLLIAHYAISAARKTA